MLKQKKKNEKQKIIPKYVILYCLNVVINYIKTKAYLMMIFIQLTQSVEERMKQK